LGDRLTVGKQCAARLREEGRHHAS
jgi:hypothetical protein